MFNATTMLSKARSNSFIASNQEQRSFYRNVYLKSDHWKSLRDEKLTINPRCEKCKISVCLDVHHINYRGLYDVRMEDLQTLCRICHNQEHEEKDKRPKYVSHSKSRKEAYAYNDLWAVFNSPTINVPLIVWILRELSRITSSGGKKPYLSALNRERQKNW